MSILWPVRTARLAGNLTNLKYNPFSYRNTSILSFFIQERPIFGAGADGAAGAAGAVFRDTPKYMPQKCQL